MKLAIIPMGSKSLLEEAKSVLNANAQLDEAVSNLRKRVPRGDRLRGEYSLLTGDEDEFVPLHPGEKSKWNDRDFCRRHGLRVCGSDSNEDRLPLWHRIFEVCGATITPSSLRAFDFFLQHTTVILFECSIVSASHQQFASDAATAAPSAQVVVVVVVIALLVGIFFYIEHMHYYLALMFGHMGSRDAQHIVGQRLFAGKGAAQDHHRAMEWFK